MDSSRTGETAKYYDLEQRAVIRQKLNAYRAKHGNIGWPTIANRMQKALLKDSDPSPLRQLQRFMKEETRVGDGFVRMLDTFTADIVIVKLKRVKLRQSRVEWIKHNRGDMPVAPDTIVETIFDGRRHKPSSAGDYHPENWRNGRVSKYRIIEPERDS